jgi:hypothetical protein
LHFSPCGVFRENSIVIQKLIVRANCKTVIEVIIASVSIDVRLVTIQFNEIYFMTGGILDPILEEKPQWEELLLVGLGKFIVLR